METILIIALSLLAALALTLAALLWRQRQAKESVPERDRGFELLFQQMNELSRVVDAKIGETNKELGESLRHQFGESQKLVDRFISEIKHITEKVTSVEETGKQMITFAEELRDLQDILKNPKQRGVLGEYYLETLLKNVLPPGAYQMQYAFSDGTIVDAAVFVKDKVIPIDSKFSLENYNRLTGEKDQAERERLERAFKADLKNRIDETAKYVKPSEGTMDFAFMFIPHEAIYYDLLVAQVGAVKMHTRDLIEYAFREKHVIIVSPTSFLAYLQTVLQGLKALQIEEQAKEIIKRVGELHRHFARYAEYHSRLGNALGVAVGHYNISGGELRKIGKDVARITGGEASLETELLERPEHMETLQ